MAAILIVKGLLISQVLGYWLTPKYLEWIRDDFKRAANFNEYNLEKWGAINRLVGVIERVFFTIIVAFDISGAAVAMVSWLLVKMATDWNRIVEENRDRKYRGAAFCSLTAGVVSLTFALIGGVFIKAGIGRI